MAAGFSYFSSPESDDAAVDAIISQAMDLSILEQIAALNTSHLSDRILPTDLETRFRKLKSFPVSDPNARETTPPNLDSERRSLPRSLNRCRSRPSENTTLPPSQSSDEDEIPPHEEQQRRKESVAKLRASDEKEISSPVKSKLRSGLGSPYRFSGEKEISPSAKSKLRSGFGSSPPISHLSSRESPSPPRPICCFGCSLKGMSKKKGARTRDRDFGLGLDDLRQNNEVISDLSSCLKEQQRMMKRAFKEEEKVSRELEDLVRRVKLVASKRLDVSAMEELPSDDDEEIK